MPNIENSGSSVKVNRGERSAERARAYERASHILATRSHNDVLMGDELAFMRTVFAQDKRFPGVEIEAIKVAHAPKPYSMFKCFWACVEDGAGVRTWLPWSIKKALNYKVTDKREVRHGG